MAIYAIINNQREFIISLITEEEILLERCLPHTRGHVEADHDHRHSHSRELRVSWQCRNQQLIKSTNMKTVTASQPEKDMCCRHVLLGVEGGVPCRPAVNVCVWALSIIFLSMTDLGTEKDRRWENWLTTAWKVSSVSECPQQLFDNPSIPSNYSYL